MKTVLFDIDGTLADNTHRQHFLLPPKFVEEKHCFEVDLIRKNCTPTCQSCYAIRGELHDQKCCSFCACYKKDWEGFFNPELQIQDTLIQPVFEVYQALKAVGHPVAFLTGRPEKYREVTQDWLRKHNLIYHQTYMRPDEDRTDDHLLKIVLANRIFGFKNILCVFEDRLRIVEAWRAAGVFCFHVGGGDFLKTTHYDKSIHCVSCGYEMDAASETAREGRTPEDGDVSVCLNCGELAIFSGSSIRKPTDAESEVIQKDPIVLTAQGLIRKRGLIYPRK